MPKQYLTNVGELGSKLSGGEKQRILIARGLLKRAEIFIFDEATSNLDSITERKIVNEMNQMLKGKTIVQCAHRLTSVVNADNILVMKDGHVVEQGTHAELIRKTDSLYTHYWDDFIRHQE